MSEVIDMTNYKKMYFLLFSSITDAIESLHSAQQKDEQMLLEGDDMADTDADDAQKAP